MQRREGQFWPIIAVAGALAISAASMVVACGSSDDSSSVAPSDASVGDSTTDVADAGGDDAAPHDSQALDGMASLDAGTSDGDAGDSAVNGNDANDADFGDALVDPVPTSCDAGGIPPVVGGTLECPSDKNLEGCPCASSGATAACWPGERVNRDHGDCKDGMTTCENDGGALVWGTCEGAMLPFGTTGAAACTCLSEGSWHLDNLSPCFLSDADGGAVGAISTLSSTHQCPTDFSAAPTESWSTDTLTSDCAGQWTLCYTLKAGDPMHPQASDCVVIQDCTTGHSPGGSTAMAFPPLPGWLAPPSAAACVAQFASTGGYGQMSINGQSDLCELEGQQSFGMTTYCPTACTGSNPPPSCATCMAGGSF